MEKVRVNARSASCAIVCHELAHASAAASPLAHQLLLRSFQTDEPLPLVMSLLMGLQHAFAMVGGLITPPYVLFRYTIE